MQTYRAAVIGCSRMGAFIDNERVGHLASEVANYLAQNFPVSHAASFLQRNGQTSSLALTSVPK